MLKLKVFKSYISYKRWFDSLLHQSSESALHKSGHDNTSALNIQHAGFGSSHAANVQNISPSEPRQHLLNKIDNNPNEKSLFNALWLGSSCQKINPLSPMITLTTIVFQKMIKSEPD